jgi:hypothetical protein
MNLKEKKYETNIEMLERAKKGGKNHNKPRR